MPLPKLPNDYTTNLVLGALLSEGVSALADDDYEISKPTKEHIASTLLSPLVGNSGGLIRNLGLDFLQIDPRTLGLMSADAYIDTFRRGTPKPGLDIPTGSRSKELAADATRTIVWPSENPGTEFFDVGNQKRAINNAIEAIGESTPGIIVDDIRKMVRDKRRERTGIPYNTLNDSELRWEALDGTR